MIVASDKMRCLMLVSELYTHLLRCDTSKDMQWPSVALAPPVSLEHGSSHLQSHKTFRVFDETRHIHPPRLFTPTISRGNVPPRAWIDRARHESANDTYMGILYLPLLDMDANGLIGTAVSFVLQFVFLQMGFGVMKHNPPHPTPTPWRHRSLYETASTTSKVLFTTFQNIFPLCPQNVADLRLGIRNN